MNEHMNEETSFLFQQPMYVYGSRNDVLVTLKGEGVFGITGWLLIADS